MDLDLLECEVALKLLMTKDTKDKSVLDKPKFATPVMQGKKSESRSELNSQVFNDLLKDDNHGSMTT